MSLDHLYILLNYWEENSKLNPKCLSCEMITCRKEYYTWGSRIEPYCPLTDKRLFNLYPCAYFSRRQEGKIEVRIRRF